MSLPSAAAAPVSGARRPILMGPPCAGAVRGAASDAASATLRTAASVRTWMRVIGGAPLHRLASDGGAPAPRRPAARTTTSQARLGRRGLDRRLASPSAAARTAAPRTPKVRTTTAPLGRGPRSRRTAGLPAECAQHSAGRKQDDADVDGAENQEPALRVHADEVLQKDDGHGAERRARERARAAERDHQERLDRGDELDVRGPHEAVVVRPEDAGKRGEEARDHEGEVLVEPHIVAERPHARLALADALEPEPERRAYEHAHRRPREGRRQEREVEERQRRREAP